MNKFRIFVINDQQTNSLLNHFQFQIYLFVLILKSNNNIGEQGTKSLG